MDESDDQISYNDVSDFEYSPETEHETTDIDEDYIAVSDNSVSDEYLSEDSLDRRHKRKKAAPKSNFKIFKRPALKLKNRREKSSSSDSSTVSSDTWEDDDIKDSDQVDSDDGHKRKIIDEELFPIIERILKTRVAAIGDIGPATSIYMGLTNQYSQSSLIPSENEEQYLIKWKNQSYLHCTWENIISLKKNGIKGFKKLENYIKKKEASEGIYLDEPDMFTSFDEPIDDYTTLERIISSRSNNLNVTEYLCKWKSLQYEDCTWESFDLVSTLFSSLIEEFLDRPNHFINKFEMKSLSNISYCKEKLFKNLDTIHSNTDGSVGLKLRDYQAEGVKWLIHSCFIGNSVILADEMGLGKTVQIIKYIHYLLSEFNLGGPHLIIVPLSTLDTWIKHFRVWASIIHVVSFVGNAKSRQFIRDYELNQDEKLKFNVLITTYEWVFKESALLSTYNWFSMIIDEGHRIKNDNSMLYQSLYNFPSYHRILMTGTPLQNSLRELWSLLHFIMPHKFNEPDVIEKYGEYQDKQQGYEELKSHISEFILRRTKKDVEKSLPPKIEQILRVNMTNMQKKYYKWILSKNYAELSRDTKGSISGFLNIIMELKKCCNHADLVIPEHQKFHTDDISNILVGSGKLILLDKLLCRLHETNSRVLIFSQMVMMLDILSTENSIFKD
ncbi:hypothetical protein MXB_5608 [Myxobolus squamalis]|nr:hypothetical protein MXB_5608 [Myxobolus squamalis]